MRIPTLLAAALLLSGAALAQEMDMQIQLMGSLGTKSSHKGDRVFGRVVQPDAFKGDTVEGRVTEVRSGGKLRGNSVLNFSFDTLQHAGQAVPISTQIRSFQNSRGQADVDEEGRVIRKGGGNTTKALGGTAAGGLIGGLAGGLKGAAIGAGVGAAASIAIIEIACDAPDIRFDPGSIVTVSAKTRSGLAITRLTGAPPAAPVSSGQPMPAYAPVAAAPAAPGASPQPNFSVLADHLIPGGKILLYDDFTDMGPSDPPPHWKVRGASLMLMGAGDLRQVVADTSQRVFMTPLVTGFPENFTVETELKFDEYGTSTWHFYTKERDQEVLTINAESRVGNNQIRIIAGSSKEHFADDEFPVDLNRRVKEAIWVQNGRLRVYLNDRRVVDANQIELPPIQRAMLEASPSGNKGARISYSIVRIAESTPDFSRSISATGRYIAYGILFDTDSDCLKPESAGAIQSIAAGLQADSKLRVRIEGHTDSTGDAAHNLDLSKRRAEAVKAVLVSQFHIDAARLDAAGLGATSPVAGNDTPQGRAENRRVELVRQ